MRWFWTIVLLCCIGASTVLAQSKTGNQYVTAIIDPNNQGLITIRTAPGTNFDPILSYPQKSFVSVMVGEKIFTNNHTGANVSGDPRFGGFLDNGVTQKIVDTLRTTWPNKNGCDIIQEVYPVRLDASAQIVIRWKIKNNSSTTAIFGQAQFLLDVQVGAQNPNDGAPILTPYGYRPIWEKYTPASTNGIPWFFGAFEMQLPNPPIFSTGITGVGYNQDVNYKLGLKKPMQMTVGDWGSPLGTAALVDFLWGVSAAAPWGTTFNDAAIHYQWDGLYIPKGSTSELARTSYGTGEFGVCTGQLFGLVFYPRRFNWSTYRAPNKYTPDTAAVEFYAFDVYSPIPQDPNHGPPSLSTAIKLHCGPNLRIIEPGTGKTYEQQTQPADIPQYGVGRAAWKVVVDKYTNCTGNLESWLKFSAQSSLSSTGPIFFNSGDGDTCEHALTIDCAIVDTASPVVDNFNESTIPPYQKTFDVHDDRSNDRGIDSITWKVSPGSGTDTSKFKIELPAFTPCSKIRHTIIVTQLDTMFAGCFDFRIKDCAGFITMHTVCLPHRIPEAVPDTNAPRITIIGSYPGDTTPCRNLCDTILITDNQEFDVGLGGITMVASANVTVSVAPIQPGASSHTAVICVIDSTIDGSLTIRAQDTVGNYTEATFCYKALQADVSHPSASDLIELIGNPASERTTLRIDVSAAYAATIRVVDLTGREVVIQQAALLVGRNDIIISTSTLSEGTYYVIAEWNGRSYARKLSVIK